MSREVRRSSPSPVSTGWQIWFAFCALLALGFLMLVAWGIVTAIEWLGRQP